MCWVRPKPHKRVLQSTELSVEITPNGYSFYRNDDNEWAVFSDPPFSKRVLPTEINSKLYLDGISIDLKDREDNKPQVVVLSSGEMTPFVYSLQFKNKSEIKLKVNANGEIEKTLSQQDSSFE